MEMGKANKPGEVYVDECRPPPAHFPTPDVDENEEGEEPLEERLQVNHMASF